MRTASPIMAALSMVLTTYLVLAATWALPFPEYYGFGLWYLGFAAINGGLTALWYHWVCWDLV